MGTNPSAKVFWGFALVDEDGEAIELDGPWAKDKYDSLFNSWEEFYIEQKGGLQEPEDTDHHSPAWDEWRARRRALLVAGGVDVELAGYDENLVDCIVLVESYATAEWAEIKPLQSLEVKPEWDSQLREWCELMGIEYRQPGWHVAALYF